jgi:imidazolonepropionase-like amidohydrolase
MLLIKNAKVMTMADVTYEKGDILVDDEGRIAAVGERLPQPDSCTVVDATGLTALPGYVDPHCHIGMFEDGMGFEGNDGNEMTDPVTPQLRAIDAINPEDVCFKEAYEHGVTTVCTGPGSANVIGGTFVAMKTYGRRVDDMVFVNPLALKCAFGENPKRVYSGLKRTPSTRMATAAILREALSGAQTYRRKIENDEKAPDRDMKNDVLMDVLDGRLYLKIHAHRADDILTAIRICKEFGVDYTLEHCTEGYRILDYLKEENAKCILGPLLSDRSKIELNKLTFKAPAEFAKAGMKFAMMTDHPVIPTMYLPVCASLAVREGLDPELALKSITIWAAEIVGIDDRVGSLEVGKDADISLFDGDPLDVRTHAKRVYINGKEVFCG